MPALQGAQCPRWDESLGHTRRGTPTSQLTCSPPALAPFCVSRKPPEAMGGCLSQLVKMKLLKKSAPQLAPFRVLSGLAAKKTPWPSPHLHHHPGPGLTTRNSAPSLSPLEAPDLLGAEGPETHGPRVGTGPPEIAEGEPWGPLAPPTLPSPHEAGAAREGGRGGEVGAGSGSKCPSQAFLVKGMCLFITPNAHILPHLCPGGLVPMAEKPEQAARTCFRGM